MNPTNKQQLFIITGANGVGKSSACEVLFQKEKDYIIRGSDVFWKAPFYANVTGREFSELRMTACAHISQVGMPCVWYGCTEPSHSEECNARRYFTDVHYLAIVCRDEVLLNRMKQLPGINDEVNSLFFNKYLIKNANKTKPHMTLLDNSDLSIKECAEKIHEWIMALSRNI
jgi:hypothetical protein